ncbi:MAG: trigger factor [Pseudomonadota bacterium]|nr:trigger factor [Pseudomonadota bacterium]
MNITELEAKGLKKSFRIVVEAKALNAELEAELKRAGERIKIPGFRPGYIPMKILQQRYGKSVQPEVIKNVINRATNQALATNNLRPALTPQVALDDYQEGGDLAFTMSFEVFPQVPEMTFDDIALDRHTFEVGDKEIGEALERIAQSTPKLNRAKEGAKAAEGDVTAIDFKGMIDGVAFEGGSAENFRLELGSGQFVDGFEKQLIGAREGEERTVTVSFPKDYAGQKVAGKEAAFAVTVKEIYTKETPAIDDAFAKERGFADLAALKEAARAQLTKEYDQIVRNQLKKQLFDILEERYDFELPQGMVDLEFNTIWDRFKETPAGREAKDDESVKEEYRDIARRRVKLGLMLAETGLKHNLRITREELGRMAMQQASLYPGQEGKILQFYRDHPERMEDLRGPLLEEKSVDFILGKVKLNDRKISVEALIAEDAEADDEAPKAKKKAKARAEEEKTVSKPKKKKAAGE